MLIYYKDLEICPKNIQTIRGILRLTAKEFSLKLGVNISNVKSWEKGTFGISDKNKIKILNLLEEKDKNNKQTKVNQFANLKEQLSNLTLIELQKLFQELELEVIIK